jgi:hypothetical protein
MRAVDYTTYKVVTKQSRVKHYFLMTISSSLNSVSTAVQTESPVNMIMADTIYCKGTSFLKSVHGHVILFTRLLALYTKSREDNSWPC